MTNLVTPVDNLGVAGPVGQHGVPGKDGFSDGPGAPNKDGQVSQVNEFSLKLPLLVFHYHCNV